MPSFPKADIGLSVIDWPYPVCDFETVLDRCIYEIEKIIIQTDRRKQTTIVFTAGVIRILNAAFINALINVANIFGAIIPVIAVIIILAIHTAIIIFIAQRGRAWRKICLTTAGRIANLVAVAKQSVIAVLIN